MSTEEELARWLRRPDKCFLDNLQFALKAWQSAELTIASKYEVVLSWLAEAGINDFKQNKEAMLPTAEYTELFLLHAQPGLISDQVKCCFVDMWLQLADITIKRAESKQSTRILAELLRGLVDYELLQDYYRADYEAQARVYGKLLLLYELHLLQFDAGASDAFQPSQESEFFAAIMKSLRDNAKRASDPNKFDSCYSAHVVQPLVQVLLLLRTHTLCFYEELLALEHLLCEQYHESALLKRVMKLPLHVRLLTLECAIENRRGVELFLQKLLQYNFCKLLKMENQEHSPELELTIAAYTLEMLRKHDISLNIKMTTGETALAFLGMCIFPLVQQHKQTHLREVLLLLCAALRLNPLILEQHIFQVTTWMIVTPKSGAAEEQQLFEEYLVLLMDMFRRLSRADKFVTNLLRSLKEWLQENTFSTIESCGKRKANQPACGASTKKSKLNVNNKQNEAEGETAFAAYLQILFKSYHKTPEYQQTAVTLTAETQSFHELQTAWPSATVGLAFSKIITGLVSKPSLVIWKTLLYSLKELLAALATETNLSVNELFQLDMHAALLCEYFAGAKLAEQYEKFSAQVLEQRRFTAEVLGTFGRFLLAQTHQKRTMKGFLECCYFAASFDLLLGYYCTDGLVDEILGSSLVSELHGFLTTQEWTLIQQRVLNFGEGSCRFLFDRLQLQRKQAKLLFLPANTFDFSKEDLVAPEATLHCSVANDTAQLQLFLQRAPNAKWFVSQLKHEEKLAIARVLHNNVDLFTAFVEDLKSVELLALCAFESLCKAFVASSKSTLMGSLVAHFDALFYYNDAGSLDQHVQLLVAAINARLEDYTVKNLPTAAVEQTLFTLSKLPIAHLRRQTKSVLFTLHLACFRDLKAAQAEELATDAFELLTDFLHFGQKVPIFKFFSIKSILRLFPVEHCWEFYEIIFASIKKEDKSSERFLLSLIDLLKQALNAGKLNEEQRRLTLIAIETLANVTGPSAKRMRKYLQSILEIYSAYVKRHFAKTEGDIAKKDKKFVEKTLAGFAPYASAVLSKATYDSTAKGTAKETDLEKTEQQFSVDEQFRRICKVYIGHSMDYRNLHAIRLMQVALNYRQQLHLDQDEIEFVLSGYWRQLNADLSSDAQNEIELNASTTESVVKMIIGHKTNEDLLLTLKNIANLATAADKKHYLNVTRLLTLIAKCPFSTIKGAIFNEQFKQITYDIILCLHKNERQQFVDTEQVLNVLACQLPVVENKMIPISLDTLDSILGFLVDINIKKFILSDTNVSIFHLLHLAMTELCTALIKQRHVLLLDRVPQFMHIFKDLLQSVVWYRSERQKNTTLPPTELDNLAELALKLEALMHIVATHSVDVKRAAPFVLAFVIHLMVANKRPTTLYPKIKTHIESICYDLVGICDHRVGRFILRCSNEAARQVYEVLVKDHKKYHKFRGKV